MAETDDLDDDDLAFLDNSTPLLIPSTSTLNILQNASKSDNIDTENFVNYLHDQLCQNECKHFEKRYQSFELFRLQEECKRFHKESADKEAKEGLKFSLDILNEISSSGATTKTANYNGVIKIFLSTYLNNYIHAKSINQNFTFPWPTYDDDVQISCLKLLKQQEFNSFRTYLLGYFEVICRLPLIDQSTQGQIFYSSAAWALGRHPFGTYFAIVLLGMKSLLRRVQLELLAVDIFCSKLKSMIDCTTNCWISIWNKFEEVSTNSSLKTTFSEILKECLQHVVFMSDSSLTHILCNFIKPSVNGSVSSNNQSNNIKTVASDSHRYLHGSLPSLVVEQDNEKSAHTFSLPATVNRAVPSATVEAVPTSICVNGFDDFDGNCDNNNDNNNNNSGNNSRRNDGLEVTVEAIAVSINDSSSSSVDYPLADAVIESDYNNSIVSACSNSRHHRILSSLDSVSSSYETQSNNKSNNNNNNNNNTFNSSTVDWLTQLEEQLGVPVSYRGIESHNATSSSTSSTSSSSSMYSRTYSHPSYMTAVHKDMVVLLTARTPSEIASVAVGIVDTINNYATTSTTTTTIANNVLKSSYTSQSSSSSSLSEVDLIGIISFCFAAYFHHRHHKGGDNEKIQQKMIGLFYLADAFLLEHLKDRREGIAIHLCIPALNRTVDLLS